MKIAFTFVLVLAANQLPTIQAYGDEIQFGRDIQPIFSEKCYDCHGPDKAEGGLRLDFGESALSMLESGDLAIVPHRPEKGTLLDRITSKDESDRMPPEGERLSPGEIAKIKKWIESGAKFDQHWAYVPVKDPSLPQVRDTNWGHNKVDRFILARLESAGLKPSVMASRSTLIKRIYYDLIGLPPDPKTVDEFIASRDPNAFEKIVDQLLASRHFGERWGRHWLDKARYADSDGYEKDRPRPNAWRYRDWVIDAINNDQPFDQFTVEQLAGDLIPNATPLQKLATAFHRQTLTNTEGGTDREQFRIEATFDRTETVSAIWMGLTMSCARCHTHKYDQITQTEYYQLFSFFNDANEINTSVSKSEAATKEYENKLHEYKRKLDKARQDWEQSKEKLRPELEEWISARKKELAKQQPPQYHSIQAYRSDTSSGAKIQLQKDGSFLVSGTVPDKDKYTIFIKSPKSPVSGIRIETLVDPALPARGPGRATNGNFVLSQVRAYVSADKEFKKHQKVEFVSARADFSQRDFSPQGALSGKAKSGWAIAPKMGKEHQLTLFFKKPVVLSGGKFLQIVLDQSYGGQHTIGKFRLQTITGNDPADVWPAAVVAALQSTSPTPKDLRTLLEEMAKNHSTVAREWQTLKELETKPAPPTMSVRVIGPANRKTRLLHRGDFLQPKDEVTAGVLNVLAVHHPLGENLPESKKPNRLELARWLASPEHPLTARVTVNHVWAHLFGKGIVATQNDFGVRGERPSHPDLLDWLAWRFPRDMKWSRKALIKKIVMSATYRQASIHREDIRKLDPTNRLLSRQNRVRVTAEIIRDLYLGASGLLSKKVGGPSVFPPLPFGVANLSYANNFKWKTSQGEDRYRRGMYTFFKRTSPHPNLISFDCPDSNTTKIDRDQSNTPLQALITLNNEVYFEAAQALAKRVFTVDLEAADKWPDSKRVEYAIRLCIARKPSPDEIALFEKLLQRNLEFYRANKSLAEKMITHHSVKSLPAETNAAWVATTRMIMNLDEFIVRD